MRNVREALGAAGYNIAEASDGVTSGPAPYLQVEIDQLHFRNYNWIWPLVPTWGDIALELSLLDSSGNVIDSYSVSGSGSSPCLLGECAFSSATRRAMTDMLEELTEVVGSDDFRSAFEANLLARAGGMPAVAADRE